MNAASADASMFLEPLWQDSLISLLLAINAAVGAPERNLPLRPLTPDDVVSIAHALQQHSYQPSQWFGNGGPATPRRPPLPTVAPQPRPAERYTVIAFAAEPSDLSTVSSRSAGLLYEDPFYAVLAAFSVGAMAQPTADLAKGLPVEVKTSSRELAWERRQIIVDQIRSGRYRADTWFTVSGPLLGTPGGEQPWRVGELSGEDLAQLALHGRAAAALSGGRPQRHGLYHYVAP